MFGMPGYFMSEMMESRSAVEVAPPDRALLASKNHREAEKRRRERIKSHLDRLRTILACDPKIDKASLLAKAVEHVRDLKQQMAKISDTHHHLLIPAENDEIVVIPTSDGTPRSPVLFSTSVCCDDRTDLLPEMVDTLRALRMRVLRAEIATLGGRVRNAMVLARDHQDEDHTNGRVDCHEDDDVGFLKEALVALINDSSSSERAKRRRV